MPLTALLAASNSSIRMGVQLQRVVVREPRRREGDLMAAPRELLGDLPHHRLGRPGLGWWNSTQWRILSSLFMVAWRPARGYKMKRKRVHPQANARMDRFHGQSF
jgi:hypothetical protein